MPSSHLILSRPLLLLPPILPSIRVFFAWGGQSIGVSASASVLPVNSQDWSPLGWTCWISLQSNGLSRVFSNTTVQKHLFFPGCSDGKESTFHAGDPGSVPELGRSPAEGNAYPLPYTCQENSRDRGAWWATDKGSQTVQHDWMTNIQSHTHTFLFFRFFSKI